MIQGLYSLSGKTFYRKISWSLEAARFGFILFQSLLNLKGTSAAAGGDNAHWISKNKLAATAVQWEICGTNSRENIANLGVACYNGNNDRSTRVLFVQHPREQGESLRQNPRYALHHSPCSLGCWTNNTLAARPASPKHLPGSNHRFA